MMKNDYITGENFAYIYVHSAKYGDKKVTVDLEDLDLIKKSCKSVYVWKTDRHSSLYALYIDFDNKSRRLHRLIMKASKDKIVDHISGDALDNRKCNLRLTDSVGNNCNSSARKSSKTSKFKGVHFSNREGKWKAQIQVNKSKKFLGTFKSEIEAAEAYDKAALHYHGEYAKLNLEAK